MKARNVFDYTIAIMYFSFALLFFTSGSHIILPILLIGLGLLRFLL